MTSLIDEEVKFLKAEVAHSGCTASGGQGVQGGERVHLILSLGAFHSGLDLPLGSRDSRSVL